MKWHGLHRKHYIHPYLYIMIKMEEDDPDKAVWNAAGVILDIDSGVQCLMVCVERLGLFLS